MKRLVHIGTQGTTGSQDNMIHVGVEECEKDENFGVDDETIFAQFVTPKSVLEFCASLVWSRALTLDQIKEEADGLIAKIPDR